MTILRFNKQKLNIWPFKYNKNIKIIFYPLSDLFPLLTQKELKKNSLFFPPIYAKRIEKEPNVESLKVKISYTFRLFLLAIKTVARDPVAGAKKNNFFLKKTYTE